MINKFNKTIFENKTELSHLSFDDSFEIDFFVNSVIFGFNAIGKSSICRFLVKNYPEQFFLINYEDRKEKYKATAAGKKITLEPDYHKLFVAKDIYEKAKDDLDLFDRIKNNTGLSRSKLASSQIPYLIDANKKENVNELAITVDEFNEIDDILKPVKKTFGSHLKEILDAGYDANDEIQNMQNSLIREFSDNYLKHLQIDENPEECPVCHQSLEPIGKSLKEVLNENIKNLSTNISCYFSDYLLGKTKEENDHFLTDLSKLITKYSVKGDVLIEYLLIEQSKDIDDINEKIKNVDSTKAEVDKENLNIQNLAQELSNLESIAKDFYINNFGFKEVKFDGKKNVLDLTLPSDRDASTYSQGELNLIILVALIIGASSSDKQNILIDDPLSSYDLTNQYKIMYEIAKFVRNYSSKKITIFTHNCEALNIARQYNKILKSHFIYIEKYNGKLFSKPLTLSQNVINIDNLIIADSSGYIKANFDREDKSYNESNGTKEQLNGIFHYDDGEVKVSRDSLCLSNTTLFNLIDKWNPSAISVGEFDINTINKIKYLFAIRVFVEKKLSEISMTIQNELKIAKTFGKKLDVIEDKYLNETKIKFPNFDLDKLKGMRVLLNQNDHFNSQSEPYYYAINISLDDLIEEVSEVKNMFII